MKVTVQIDTKSISELKELKSTVELLLTQAQDEQPQIGMPTYLRSPETKQEAQPSFVEDNTHSDPIAFASKVTLREMICSISGCFQRVKTKGVCQKHYMEEYNAKKKARKEVNTL